MRGARFGGGVLLAGLLAFPSFGQTPAWRFEHGAAGPACGALRALSEAEQFGLFPVLGRFRVFYLRDNGEPGDFELHISLPEPGTDAGEDETFPRNTCAATLAVEALDGQSGAGVVEYRVAGLEGEHKPYPYRALFTLNQQPAEIQFAAYEMGNHLSGRLRLSPNNPSQQVIGWRE